MELNLGDQLGLISIETFEAKNPLATIIVAHGAGAGIHHPWMVELANELCALNMHVVRFNFPYMEQGKRSTGSPNKNIEAWRLVHEHVSTLHPDIPIIHSGKSYGGRMASHLAANHSTSASGLIYYGFPLHAPGRDSKDRAAHLSEVKIPQLFLQGKKDKLANIGLMNEVVKGLPKASIVEFEDADHSFNVPKRTGMSKSDMIKSLAKHSEVFIKKLVG